VKWERYGCASWPMPCFSYFNTRYTGHRIERKRAKLSNIHITERTSSSAKRVLDQNALSINTQIDHIIRPGIPRWRFVVQSDGSSQRVVALSTAAARRILILPDPPGTINLRMVQIKPRITRRIEQVTCKVRAQLACFLCGRWYITTEP
jgi:hypothetical protein